MAGPSKSTKSVQKEKQKIIEDKTFGLKNKNKSKSVYKQISQVKKQVSEAGLTKEDKKKLEEREAKKMERFLQKQREKELKELFTDADAEKKKKEEEEAAAAKAAAGEGANGEGAGASSSGDPTEYELLDALETLAEVENELTEEEAAGGEALTLEQLIERERAKIINGTPVTEETFKRWKQFKNELKEREKKRKAEEQLENYKKKGSGLSGRALFEYNQALFVDDEAADVKMERQEEEDIEVDEDLFLDDDEEEGEEAAEEEDNEEYYDPATWKEKDTPKSLLTSLLGTRKLPMPVFENILQGGGEGFSMKCVLPNADNGQTKEFLPSKVYPNKKLAEHNAALKALRWLEGQGVAEAAK